MIQAPTGSGARIPACILSRDTKILSVNLSKDKLKSVNRNEIDRLQHRWTTDECIEAIMNFFQRKD